jgi:hypothetical protein
MLQLYGVRFLKLGGRQENQYQKAVVDTCYEAETVVMGK